MPTLPPLLFALTKLEVGLIVVIAILLFMLWRLTKHQECRFAAKTERPIGESLCSLAGCTHGHLTDGNAVQLIEDAAYFDAIAEAIIAARKSVHFETFLWKEGEAGTRLAKNLADAARRGLSVRVLVDDRGSSGIDSSTIERMEEAGCQVRRFHRWHPWNLGRLNVRDHRKILVLDGRTAFVGGHCITDDWLRDGDKLPRFRDVTARFDGPVVAAVQSCFFENWTEVTDELFTDESTFPRLEPKGSVRAHVAYVKADRCPSAVQVLHHLAIGHARRSIRIQNPYFLPDSSAVKALVAAAKRGVDVRIMVPALNATDNRFVARAGRYQLLRLLEGGVRIFTYTHTLLHQKVITIDAEWCGIGSSNFDDRSFDINDEITVGVPDEKIVQELESIFEKDAERCHELDLDRWRRRPAKDKLLDGFLYLFNEQF